MAYNLHFVNNALVQLILKNLQNAANRMEVSSSDVLRSPAIQTWRNHSSSAPGLHCCQLLFYLSLFLCRYILCWIFRVKCRRNRRVLAERWYICRSEGSCAIWRVWKKQNKMWFTQISWTIKHSSCVENCTALCNWWILSGVCWWLWFLLLSKSISVKLVPVFN